MIDRVFKALTLGATLFFLVLLYFAVPAFLDPVFEVVNRSPEPVSVIALWRGNERAVGTIEPMMSRRFSVDDEAAMVFRVAYASGSIAESKPLYFSRGLSLIATVTANGVTARYDFEQ